MYDPLKVNLMQALIQFLDKYSSPLSLDLFQKFAHP